MIAKIKTFFLFLLTMAFLALAFSFDSPVESRLFFGLSIISGLLIFKLASRPVPAPAPKKEKTRRLVHEYAHQEC